MSKSALSLICFMFLASCGLKGLTEDSVIISPAVTNNDSAGQGDVSDGMPDTGKKPAEISIEPSNVVALSNTMIGTTGIAQVFEIYNSGEFPVTACDTAVLSGANVSEFVLSNANKCNQGIVEASSCAGISVAAKPASSGTKTATLKIVCGNLSQSVDISYMAQTTPVPASIVFNPTSYDFQKVSIGMTSVAKTFVVQNPGDTKTTTCSAATLSGANLSEFVLSGQTSCNGGINAKGSCSGITVAAKPTSSGSKKANLNLTCGSLNQSVSLSYESPVPSSFLVNADWESGDLMQGIFYPYSLCNKPYDAQISTDHARTGTHSVRFEVRSTDVTCGYSKRAELYIPRTDPIAPSIRWYGWSEYLPSDFANDAKAEAHFQIHHPEGGGPGSPPIGLWIQNDHWYLVQTFDENEDGIATQTKHDLGVVTKGQWVDWALYFDYKIDASGKIQLYKNGTKVLDISGANYNKVGGMAQSTPYVKFGIYKWPWATPGTYNPSTRITYIDSMRIGDSSNTFNDFVINSAPTK